MLYKFLALILLIGLLGGAAGRGDARAAAWQSKVDPAVLDAAAGGEVEFLIFLTEQADLSPAGSLATRIEKGRYVYETLSALAAASQTPLRRELARRGVAHRPFWVANMIWARGDAEIVQALAERADVAHLYANPTVRLAEPALVGGAAGLNQPAGVEWNIAKVGAPEVWAAGFTGQGAVVAGQDTGYQWDHPALKGKYRGWDGASAIHDYNWHDAIHSGGGVCGADSPAPCDDHSHGTHTMGTMVGDDGAGNQIGMAPGAAWIGCRNMDQGVGTPATYSECYQWFIAPTKIDGSQPDPARAPDVINNSWGCPASEGCTDPAVLLAVVQAVRAAGIVTVHAAGNSGSACSTVREPAAIYAESFTVGSTSSSDIIASSSSRGPVTADGSGRRKPDIAAPGVSIRSSVPGGGYAGGWSGTSMAAPHVAGAVALLISAYPWLRGDVAALENVIERSAVPRVSIQGCGGDTPTAVPNNVYGWGRLDALAAYRAACRAPAALVAVTIGRLDAKTVQLAWNPVPGATRYQVWSASNAPYFSPAPGNCAADARCTIVATAGYTETTLGDPASNRTYVVLPGHACGATATEPSPRTGGFSFGLVPGD